MTDPTLSPSAPRTGRKLRIALVLSLAVNLAVGGVLAGSFLRDGPPRAGRDFGLGPISEALSREDRKALRAAFVAQHPDIGADRQAMRGDIDALLVTLRATPFDPAALDAALATIAERNGALIATGRAVLAERIKTMDADTRAAFADRLEKKMPRPGKRDKDHDD